MALLISRPFDIHGVAITEELVRSVFLAIVASQITRSIAWVFLRTLPESGIKVGEEIWYAGFLKEFTASQTVTSDTQQLDYSELWGERIGLIPYSWCELARHIANSVARSMERAFPLFPKVNRIKNVAQESAREYLAFVGSSDKSIYDVTTRDLEVLYGHTGYKVGGACEMRAAWKYNDLKPRVYYAQGGHDYFASRYLKLIAQRIMESVEATSVQRRRTPFDYLDVEDQDYLVYWDYSSFTTSLSELKYFVYYLAEAVKECERGPIRLFDYHLGIVEVMLSDILHGYNEAVNMNSPFSIHRMIDRFGFLQEITEFTQQNSGMLGVAGNIGLSTALHGYAASQVVDRGNVVCVGDDAVAVVKGQIATVDGLIDHMQKLGSLHGDKHSILPPIRGEETQVGKFLKRALTRYSGFAGLDVLFDFAPLPYIDGKKVPGRTVPMPTYHERLYKFCSVTGELLWSLKGTPTLSRSDFWLIEEFLRRAFSILKISPRGFLPGHMLCDSVVAHFCCPSIEFDKYSPQDTDWLEYLFDYSPQVMFTLPILAEKQNPMWFEDKYSSQTQHRFWSAMEDLGYVTLEDQWERVEVLSEVNRRTLRRHMKTLDMGKYTKLLRITLEKPLPEHFRPFTEPDKEVFVPMEYIEL
jgi:hypothetical protein